MTTEDVRLVIARLRDDADFAEQVRTIPDAALAPYRLSVADRRRVERLLAGSVSYDDFFL